MLMIEINDTRTINEFKSVTFSGYKRADVKKHLISQLFNANLEQSLNWTAELICCGAFMELWEIIMGLSLLARNFQHVFRTEVVEHNVLFVQLEILMEWVLDKDQ